MKDWHYNRGGDDIKKAFEDRISWQHSRNDLYLHQEIWPSQK
jgi:hypothetical protein